VILWNFAAMQVRDLLKITLKPHRAVTSQALERSVSLVFLSERRFQRDDLSAILANSFGYSLRYFSTIALV
jgi:hypothetical protein